MSIPIFAMGLIIGSFLNVCIYRIPIGQSIAYPPSACGHCGRRLKAKDLIPLISYIFLKGKCSHCGEYISIRYFIVELTTGFLFLFTYLKFGLVLLLLPYLVLLSALISITFIDIDHQIIPNSINLFLVTVFIFLNVFLFFIPWKDSLLGGLIGGGFLFLIVLLSKGSAMGMGDVKLMAVLGLYLGWKLTILNLLLSFIVGGVFSLVLLAFKIKGRKDSIAFGPWIVMATIISIFFGGEIINWYLKFL